MAYYSKKQVKDFIVETNNTIENKGHKSITPIEEATFKLGNEDDIVGFFWMNINQEDESAKLKMEGKAFVRIDYDLYTDDRFALDLYQAQMDGDTVSNVIKNRNNEKDRAESKIANEKETLENEIIEKGKTKE